MTTENVQTYLLVQKLTHQNLNALSNGNTSINYDIKCNS